MSAILMTSKHSILYTYTLVFIMYLVFWGKFLVTKTGLSAPPLINYILMMATILAMISYLPKYGVFVAKFIGVLAFYLLFKTLFWGMGFATSLIYYSNMIWCFFLCVIVFEGARNGRINDSVLKHHFYFIFLVECILGIAQYFIPSVYEFFHIATWSWNGTTIDEYVETNMLVAQAAPIVGTFFKPQTFANQIAIFIMIGFCDLFIYPKQYPKVRLLIILTGFVLCFLTGVRTPALMLVLAILYLLYKYKRTWVKYYLIGIICAITFFIGYALTDSTGSLARLQLGFLALFSGDMDLLSTQTIFYSFYMIPYFLANPIFGVSLGKKYILGSYVMEDFSPTDVQLFYILCEVGIIGFFIYIWPVLKLGKISNIKPTFQNVKPVLLICFLLTLIDDTFIDFDAKISFALCFSLFYKPYESITNN